MLRMQSAGFRCYEGPAPLTTQGQSDQLPPSIPRQSNHLLPPNQSLTTSQAKTPCACWLTQEGREDPSWHHCPPQEPGRWEPCPRYTRRCTQHPMSCLLWPRRCCPLPPSLQSRTTQGASMLHDPTTSRPFRRRVKQISAHHPVLLCLPPCPA